jgi:hypothetical protein
MLDPDWALQHPEGDFRMANLARQLQEAKHKRLDRESP